MSKISYVKVEEDNEHIRTKLTEEIGKLKTLGPKIEEYEKIEKLNNRN